MLAIDVSYFSSIFALFDLVDVGDRGASRPPAPPAAEVIEESPVPSVLRLFKPFIPPLADFLLVFTLSTSSSLDSPPLEMEGLYAFASAETAFFNALRDRLAGVRSAVD